MADITQPPSDSDAQIETRPQEPKTPETSEDPAAKVTIDALKDGSNRDITETVEKALSLKEALTQQLKGAAKVETPAWTPEELEGKEVLAITVEDRERFLEDGPMKAMEPLIGRLVYNTFQQRGEEEPQYPVKDDDPLRKTFMDLIDYQEKHKPNHAIYGTVVIPKHLEKF